MRSPTFTPKQTSSLRSARVGWLSSLTGRDGHSVPARRSLSRAVAHFFVNAHEGDTEVALRFTPAQNHLRLFLAFAMATQTNPVWFGPKGEPKLLGMALALHTFKDHLYVAGPPIWLQKLLFAALSPLARLVGYRVLVRP